MICCRALSSAPPRLDGPNRVYTSTERPAKRFILSRYHSRPAEQSSSNLGPPPRKYLCDNVRLSTVCAWAACKTRARKNDRQRPERVGVCSGWTEKKLA